MGDEMTAAQIEYFENVLSASVDGYEVLEERTVYVRRTLPGDSEEGQLYRWHDPQDGTRWYFMPVSDAATWRPRGLRRLEPAAVADEVGLVMRVLEFYEEKDRLNAIPGLDHMADPTDPTGAWRLHEAAQRERGRQAEMAEDDMTDDDLMDDDLMDDGRIDEDMTESEMAEDEEVL